FKKIIFSLIICSPAHLTCMNLTTKHLTLDQKIGQLFMVPAVADEAMSQGVIQKKPYRMDKEYITDLINTHHIGGLIIFGKSNIDTQAERTRYFQSISS